MKQIKLCFVIICSIASVFFSCQGKKAGATNEVVADISGNSDTSSAGDASFSATIDGVVVSGKGIDELQLSNTVFIYPKIDHKPETILFDLMSTKKGDDYYFFRCTFPNKEGIYNKSPGDKTCSCSIVLDFDLKSSDNFARYDGQTLIVNIQKITSSRLQGTFSGTFSLSADTRSKVYKNQVTIADGKFDIPFSSM
ncbi:MAG TPA: hypothetical protein VGG71_07020 [Chitinophagaceae bacterium]|jgi:hypothetical protein